jgi:hypothetical protein
MLRAVSGALIGYMAFTNPTETGRFGLCPLNALAAKRPPLPGVDVRRVRRAIDTAEQTLTAIPATDDVRRVMKVALRLRREVDQWVDAVPTPEERDRVLREVLAIHVGALQVVRVARERAAAEQG